MKTPLTFTRGADTADDLELMARGALATGLFDFVAGGAGEERTVAANRAGFGRLRLLPRVLRYVSAVDTSTSIFGTDLAAPIFTYPMGGLALLRSAGDLAFARAAAAALVGMIAAVAGGATIEDIAAAASGARWLGLYWNADPSITADFVARAEAASYRAIVLTVDAPIRGTRRRIARSGFAMPPGAHLVNLERHAQPGVTPAPGGASIVATGDRSLSWKDVEWLRSTTRLPVILKGIMTTEDAPPSRSARKRAARWSRTMAGDSSTRCPARSGSSSGLLMPSPGAFL